MAKLIAPQSAAKAAFDKIDDTTPIPGGTQRGEMFVKTFTDTTLDVGETQPPLHLDLHCLDQGDAKIKARIHADVDQSALFPEKAQLEPGKDRQGGLIVTDPVDVQAIREHCVLPERGRIMSSNAPGTQPPRELPALSGAPGRGMQHAGIGREGRSRP